tara:strand:+ start:161 stop:340 length:180 start_codon:yes stop_codon:yes gene_type:complete
VSDTGKSKEIMGLIEKIKGLFNKKPEEATSSEPEESPTEGLSSTEDSSEEESGDANNNW